MPAFLASITHDAEVQKCLPQVLIGNERQLPAAMMKKLEGLPPNVMFGDANLLGTITP